MAPSISPAVAVAIRAGFGLFMLATLVRLLPHARRYFLSERWGGYGEPGWRVDGIQNPIVMPVVLALWMAACIALMAGRWTVMAALVNVACCHYFFIAMRWRGVLRGMGAPGFIAAWLAAAVLLLEVTRHYAPNLQSLSIFVLQIDFALIMVTAGIYKLFAGYRNGDGMELGMINPEWGYWGRQWGALSPRNPIFEFFNQMAWLTEVVAGILMLFPQTRFIGAAIIFLSFIFIATQIRLGFLCEMVMVCCFLFIYPGSAADVMATTWLPGANAVEAGGAPAWLSTGLTIALWGYLIALPLARVGQSYNLYAKRRLPSVLQQLLDWYSNAFGLILWRVFSADHTNFAIHIYEVDTAGHRRLISKWTEHLRFFARFNQVAEAIVVTTLFTTLKYYPSNGAMFVERMLRYSKTVPVAPGSRLLFEHVSLVKRGDRFEFVPAAEFTVDVAAGTVDEVTLDPTRSVRAPIAGSPVHEGAKPGSYAPLRS
jgi:hypothetical protein